MSNFSRYRRQYRWKQHHHNYNDYYQQNGEENYDDDDDYQEEEDASEDEENSSVEEEEDEDDEDPQCLFRESQTVDAIFSRELHGGTTRLGDKLVAGFYGCTRRASAIVEYHNRNDDNDDDDDDDDDGLCYGENIYESDDNDNGDEKDEKMITVTINFDSPHNGEQTLQARFSDAFRRRHGGPGVAKLCIQYPRYDQWVAVETPPKRKRGRHGSKKEKFEGNFSVQFGNDQGYFKGIHRLYKHLDTKELRLWIWDMEDQNSY